MGTKCARRKLWSILQPNNILKPNPDNDCGILFSLINMAGMAEPACCKRKG